MVSNNKEKTIVYVQYPCYICANEYSGASQVINHVHNIHGYILKPRQVGHHRPPENHYAFENDIKMKCDIQHFGCPSCWFHCPKTFETLMEHIMQEHQPVKVPGFVHRNQEEEDELESDTDDIQEIKEGGEENDNVQQFEMTSDEEQDTDGRGNVEHQPTDVKKEGTPSSTASGSSNTGGSSVIQGEAWTLLEAETEVAKDIIQKISDLNDMFKNLFTKKSS